MVARASIAFLSHDMSETLPKSGQQNIVEYLCAVQATCAAGMGRGVGDVFVGVDVAV